MRFVPQCPQNVRVRWGEETYQASVEPWLSGECWRSAVRAGTYERSAVLWSCLNVGGDGAGRNDTDSISAGAQIHAGRMEPVAARQSLQWSAATRGKWTEPSGERGWSGRRERAGTVMR